MKCDAHLSPASISPTSYLPTSYNNLALATSASISTTLSVWSDSSSQTSDDGSSHSSDSDSCDSLCAFTKNAHSYEKVRHHRRHVLKTVTSDALPAELRQNPRRTAAGAHGRTAAPPPLVRQSERKVNFVDSLVDSSTQIVEAIWPLSSAICRSELGSKAVLPLRTFIQETLRRSRTSYSTLQVALYYLILIKPHVPKHNFTMEQPEDRHADRALQCGRRMFLAALILASKYLQDKNYSARAWSKISGLNTREIHLNEMAFLHAVDYKLHIAEDVFRRWVDIILKYTPPPSPPSPGGVPQAISAQVFDWKQLILRLNPELTNITGLPIPARSSDLCALSPRSILNMPQDAQFEPAVPKSCIAATLVEPAVIDGRTSGRLGPFLPTPRLTPQSSGLCTPAVSVTPSISRRGSAMGLAMAQANSTAASQFLDRVPASITSSPQTYCPVRRSSLANSVSTASSPESMISDSSRSSRSSSFSSASSFASATLLSTKLNVQSRFRGSSKLCSERLSQRPTIPSVPEDYDENCFTSSPEAYTGPVGKLGDMAMETTLARREQELDEMSTISADEHAARALQQMQSYCLPVDSTSALTAKTGIKRSRTESMDCPLQENVRDLLWNGYGTWPETSLPLRGMAYNSSLRVPVPPNFTGSTKRVCCSAEAAQGFEATAAHAMALRGPGMWEHILN